LVLDLEITTITIPDDMVEMDAVMVMTTSPMGLE
jgi:hypothetical protein